MFFTVLEWRIHSCKNPLLKLQKCNVFSYYISSSAKMHGSIWGQRISVVFFWPFIFSNIRNSSSKTISPHCPDLCKINLKSVHFLKVSFQYNISWHQNKVSWCCNENYHNFETNEDCATVFLKWTDFRKCFINESHKEKAS